MRVSRGPSAARTRNRLSAGCLSWEDERLEALGTTRAGSLPENHADGREGRAGGRRGTFRWRRWPCLKANQSPRLCLKELGASISPSPAQPESLSLATKVLSDAGKEAVTEETVLQRGPSIFLILKSRRSPEPRPTHLQPAQEATPWTSPSRQGEPRAGGQALLGQQELLRPPSLSRHRGARS